MRGRVRQLVRWASSEITWDIITRLAWRLWPIIAPTVFALALFLWGFLRGNISPEFVAVITTAVVLMAAGLLSIRNSLRLTTQHSGTTTSAMAEPSEPVSYDLQYALAHDIRSVLAATIPGIRVGIEVRRNAVVIYGTAGQHEQVKKLLASLDREEESS